MDLPVFKYHRDAIRSGSIQESPNECQVCGEARGYIYTGPVFSEEDLDDAICPWCLADGSAAETFEATFVDSEAFPDETPAEAVEEISTRTPGYNTWQEQKWFVCCGDAMTFVEPVGTKEIRERYPQLEGDVLWSIVYDLNISGGAAKRMLESLQRDAGPTAYVFQCPKCETYKAFVDGIFDISEN